MLARHVDRARAATAGGSAHALDLAGLRAPDIRVWTLAERDDPIGIGALRRLSAQHGEIKSMYVAEAARGRGAGGAMLRHIIATARAECFARLSLETGAWSYFAPAWALYRRHGFVDCAPFGAYVADPNSLFMTLDLPRRGTV